MVLVHKENSAMLILKGQFQDGACEKDVEVR